MINFGSGFIDEKSRQQSSAYYKAVDGFAHRNPEVTVTVLRFCNALGPDLRTTHTRLFDLPAVPAILGHGRPVGSTVPLVP